MKNKRTYSVVELEKKDSRIKLFVQPKNLGVVKNIEFLLKQVKSR